jgi:hypothetical protein
MTETPRPPGLLTENDVLEFTRNVMLEINRNYNGASLAEKPGLLAFGPIEQLVRALHVARAERDAACAIAAHQQNGRVHPLTCGIDSNHAPLVPFVKDGRLMLRCLGSMRGLDAVPCPYVQENIPGVVR